MFTTKYAKTKPTTGKAAVRQMKQMEKDSREGKGTLSYTPKKKKVLKYAAGGFVGGLAAGLAGGMAANRAGSSGTSAKDKAALKDYDTAQDAAQDAEED